MRQSSPSLVTNSCTRSLSSYRRKFSDQRRRGRSDAAVSRNHPCQLRRPICLPLSRDIPTAVLPLPLTGSSSPSNTRQPGYSVVHSTIERLRCFKTLSNIPCVPPPPALLFLLSQSRFDSSNSMTYADFLCCTRVRLPSSGQVHVSLLFRLLPPSLLTQPFVWSLAWLLLIIATCNTCPRFKALWSKLLMCARIRACAGDLYDPACQASYMLHGVLSRNNNNLIKWKKIDNIKLFIGAVEKNNRATELKSLRFRATHKALLCHRHHKKIPQLTPESQF